MAGSRQRRILFSSGLWDRTWTYWQPQLYACSSAVIIYKKNASNFMRVWHSAEGPPSGNWAIIGDYTEDTVLTLRPASLFIKVFVNGGFTEPTAVVQVEGLREIG